jgi:alkylmercury lyase-like protein
MALDTDVRLHVMRRFVEDGAPPTAKQTALALELSVPEVEGAFRRLADGHVFVLEPGTLDIWMANPLCARPTSFRVHAGERSWWGTCVWDSLGILAMLGTDGFVSTTCPDCGEPLELRVVDGNVRAEPSAIGHFGVPAAHWWDDIGYT